MRKFSLSEIVRAGRSAENVSLDGAVLRYVPEQQVLGMAAIIEVTWPHDARSERFGLVEVIPDESGELLVRPASVPNTVFLMGEKLRLPLIPAVGWIHGKDCDCGVCRD